ncbi:hypothetical protein CSHISOI_04596, partial [Colletotrichum shisoi]
MSAFLTLASVINSSRGNHSSNLPPGNPAPFSNAAFSLPATMIPNAVPQSHAHTMPSPQYPALTHSPAPAPFHLSSSPSSTFFALNLIFFSSPFRPRSAMPFPPAPDSAPGTRPTKGAMSPVMARIPLHALVTFPLQRAPNKAFMTPATCATVIPSVPESSHTPTMSTPCPALRPNPPPSITSPFGRCVTNCAACAFVACTTCLARIEPRPVLTTYGLSPSPAASNTTSSTAVFISNASLPPCASSSSFQTAETSRYGHRAPALYTRLPKTWPSSAPNRSTVASPPSTSTSTSGTHCLSSSTLFAPSSYPFASRKKSTVSTALHSATSLPSTPPTSSTASAVRSANRLVRARLHMPAVPPRGACAQRPRVEHHDFRPIASLICVGSGGGGGGGGKQSPHDGDARDAASDYHHVGLPRQRLGLHPHELWERRVVEP